MDSLMSPLSHSSCSMKTHTFYSNSNSLFKPAHLFTCLIMCDVVPRPIWYRAIISACYCADILSSILDKETASKGLFIRLKEQRTREKQRQLPDSSPKVVGSKMHLIESESIVQTTSNITSRFGASLWVICCICRCLFVVAAYKYKHVVAVAAAAAWLKHKPFALK